MNLPPSPESEPNSSSAVAATEEDTLTSRLRASIAEACRGRNPAAAAPTSVADHTRTLAHFAVHCAIDSGDKRRATPRTRTQTSLAASIRRMHEKHALLFRSMMDRLHISRRVDFYRGFTELAEDLFGDEVSWAKIVALYAFGARLGQYCVDQDLDDLLEPISSSLAQFTIEHLGPFISSQGGWEALCDAFPVEEDVETRLWRTLVHLGLGLGLLALYLVYRK